MTESAFDPDSEEAAALALAGMRSIFEWLATPPAARPTDDLVPLRRHLVALRETATTAAQRDGALGLLYMRSMAVIERIMPPLIEVELPVPRKTRQLVRGALELLQLLATQLLAGARDVDEHLIRGLRQPPELLLWRCLNALSRHLLISNLVTAPAGVGIWQLLHETYAVARHAGLADKTPAGERFSLQHVYYSSVLIGCAQPTSFTPREIDFIAAYLERFAEQVESRPEAAHGADPEHNGLFWIDPQRDAPAFAWARKPPPPETPVLIFSCDRLAALLHEQLAALDAGRTPHDIGLPPLAGCAAGHGVLRRLAGYWGNPLKRRFQRRRQNYRAVLCSGLDRLWQLLQDGHAASADISSWMITNESPDGYALMHVSGRTGKLAVGDVAAIRTETGTDWQICLVRWALSENPEHFELGLQILAPRAEPALLVLPSDHPTGSQYPVLILPKLPPLRETQTLVAPSDLITERSPKLVLVLERENIEVREVRTTRLEEQTASIEAYAIQSDAGP